MKAVVSQRYGGPEVLAFTDVAEPVPGPGEVLVRVHAASVNAADWHVMRGDPYVARLALPATFGRKGPRHAVRGRDFAGRVEALGDGVTRLRVGDEVYGDANDREGAFAELVAVPEDLVELKPGNLSFEQAAAVPLAGATALVGMRDVAGVTPGTRVLVNGASGGVGTFAVQVAAAFGAEVTAVCRARNADMVRALGADRVVDYTREDFADEARRYDVLLDLVGNRSLAACRRAVTASGTVVLSGGGVSRGGSLVGPMALIVGGRLLNRFVGQRLLTLTLVPKAEHLTALRELIEAGKVAPVVDRTYPLSEAAEAIRYLEQEHARAKVVITL